MSNYMIKYFFLLLTIPVCSFGESILVVPGASPTKISATTVLNYSNFVLFGPISNRGSTVANITGFIYGSRSYGEGGVQCTTMAGWKCIDGYCGIPVNTSNPDIIYIPTGTVSAKFRSVYGGSIVNGSILFNTNTPTFNQAQRYSSYACFPQSPNSQSFYINSGTGNATDFNANLQWYIYAPALAQPRKFSVNSIGITGVFGSSDGSKVAIPANDIEIRDTMECSVSPPSTVDFGTINRNKITETVQGVKNGNLTINCTSNSQAAKRYVKLSFTANTEFNGKSLILKNSTGNTLANIKGRLTSPLSGTCSSYTAGDVLWDGSTSQTIPNVGVGQKIISLTWTLCKNSSSAMRTGEGTAQATVTIDWE